MNNKFDIKGFQSKIYNDFTKLATTISLAMVNSVNNYSSEKSKEIADNAQFKNGLVTKMVLRIFSSLGKKAEKEIIRQPDFAEQNRKAAEIVDNPKVKKILCRTLKKEVTPDLFKEARQVKLVKVVTTLLLKDEIIEEFSLEKDVRLFSLIAVRIYSEGISDYCK